MMSSPSSTNQEGGNLNSKVDSDEQHALENTTSYNPTLENECGEGDLEVLKGDVIGETLYSERFVLNTLLKVCQLKKDLQDEEDLERDLCSLWDMTVEKDVVIYLLDQDVLELFGDIIKTTLDKRLSEILVGILANLCNVKEARTLLDRKEATVQALLELTSCKDSLTLEQLMRLLAVVFVKMEEQSIMKWYDRLSQDYVDNICSIMANSASSSLILQTLEALNAVIAKFTLLEIPSEGESTKSSFEDVFVKTSLIAATIESFETVHKERHEDDEEIADIEKLHQTFCNIHSIISQYGKASKEAYEPLNDKMLWCLVEILKTVQLNLADPTKQQLNQDSLESLNDILRVLTLSQPLTKEITRYLFGIYMEVSKSNDNLKRKHKTDDFEDVSDADEDNENDYQLLLTLILNTIYYLVLKEDKKTLIECVSQCPRECLKKLIDSFQQQFEEESLKVCYLKLQDVLEETESLN